MLGPDIQRTLDISETTAPRAARASAASCSCSRPSRSRGSPTGTCAREVLAGATALWSAFVALTGRRHQRVPDGHRPRAARGSARLGPHPDLAVADRRPVPDRRPHADVRVREPRPPGRPGARARSSSARSSRSPASEADGWRWAMSCSRDPRRAARRSRRCSSREPARGRNEQEAVLGADARPVDEEPPVRLVVGVAAPEEGRDLLLPHPRHRRARVRARRACPVRSASCSTRPYGYSALHARLDAARSPSGRARRHPDRGPVRRPAVPPRPVAYARADLRRAGHAATASSSPSGLRFESPVVLVDPVRDGATRARAPPSRRSGRRSRRWCRTGCGRRRSRWSASTSS